MAHLDENAVAKLKEAEQWALDELDAAKVRVINLRCGAEAYNQAIAAVDNILWLIDRIHHVLNGEYPDTAVEPYPLKADAPVEHPAETEAAAVFEEPEPAPVVDISEVRTKAKAARDAGVDLAAVWGTYGGKKLSEVPHDKYAEVMTILDEKMKELE